MTIINKTNPKPKRLSSDIISYAQTGPNTVQRLHDVMDGFGPSMFVGLLTKDGILTFINKSALKTFDLTLEDVVGKTLSTLPAWAFSSTSRRLLRKAIKLAVKGEASRFDVLIRDKLQQSRIMDFFLHPVFESESQVAFLVLSACDVTDRQQAQHSLHMTQFAVDNAEGAIFQVGADSKVIYVNQSACHHLGYPREKIIGMPLREIDMHIRDADWPMRWAELKARGSSQSESVHRHSSGREIPVEVSVTYFEYQGEEYSFLYVKDISINKANAARIDYFAYYDRITRLPNRMLLTNRLNQAINVAENNKSAVIVLFIGIDRFKLVNDILGNIGGDEVLQIAADRMVTCVSAMDTVARIGGDEFAIVLERASGCEEELLLTVQRILDIFTHPFVVYGQELFVMCSIGMAVYPENGNDTDELLKNASAALHQAKAQGGNDYHWYTSAPVSRDPERWQLEADLRHALGRNEFLLHYQPRIDVTTGKILGAEALLRWQHPVKGMILPEQFITIAEETGLILKIGEWVLLTACKQQKQWSENGVGFKRIGVNLSARQFRQKDLVKNIASILDETGIDPDLLELELTESLLMHDVATATETMLELKELGVHIALDDFGTGYSSLSYLRYFPIDTLKIDRSFVNEITLDENSVAIAEAIIVMAHRLHFTVIAEGVETEQQLAVLRELGCDQIQGFHFSKPLTEQEVVSLLNK